MNMNLGSSYSLVSIFKASTLSVRAVTAENACNDDKTQQMNVRVFIVPVAERNCSFAPHIEVN